MRCQQIKSVTRTRGFSSKIRSLNGCSIAQLKAAGFDAKQLIAAGFTPQQLLAAGFFPEDVQAAVADSEAFYSCAGCDPTKLRALYQQGVSAARIRELNGCNAEALKNAGYGAKALSDAGFTPQALLTQGLLLNS